MKTRQNHSCVKLAGILALALLLSAAPLVVAAPGDLDPSFGGGDGIVSTEFGSGASGEAMALDSAGRIIVAGTVSQYLNSDFALVRYMPDGTLDPSFGVGGKVTIDFGGDDYGLGVVVDSAGRIVVAGLQYSCCVFAVARLLDDGTLDPGFGVDGRVLTSFSGSAGAYAVAVDALDRVIAAGVVGTPTGGDFALARYLPNGNLDPAFDGDGLVTTDISGYSDESYGIGLDSLGRIVVVGHATPTNYLTDFAVVRYLESGTLDPAFDGDGIVVTDLSEPGDVPGRGDYARGVAFDSLGRIVVGGESDSSITHQDYAAARYMPNGQLDPAFDGDGKVITDFASDSDLGRAVAVDANNRVILTGAVWVGFTPEFGVTRYLPNGALDLNFGVGGKVVTNFGGGGSAVRVDALGRILVGGSSSGLAAVRLLGDGTEPPPPTAIDIKPGEPDNIISLGERGKLQVAILSDDGLNAPYDVNMGSLTFGHSGDEKSLLYRKGWVPDCRFKDVNGDERMDTVCWFLVKLAGFKLGDTEGILKGSTVFDSPLEGHDRVQIVP